MADKSRLVRMSTSVLLLRRVDVGISEWLQKRFAADSRGQHTTQLSAISALLRQILGQLEKELDTLENADAGIVYESCERFDRRTIWLERLWRFFRRRFDQREEAERCHVLQVADEMIWSLYSRPIDKAMRRGLRSGPAPAPVAFIEEQYSPEAFPSEMVPPDLKDESEATNLLKDHLNRMPVPIVRMTPACVELPWLVVYLAHETGHHLQFDLLPQRRLVSEFRQVIESAVRAKTASDDAAKKWGSWSKEIFADIFSVIAMGPWAVWAMVELDFKSQQRLNEERDGYPPPSMRLALLAEACDRLTGTVSGTKALRGLFQPEESALRAAVLDAALGVLPGLGGTLSDFWGGIPSTLSQDVAVWHNVLYEKEARDPQPDLKNARVLTAAAMTTWEKLAGETAREALTQSCSELGARYVGKVAAGAPDDGPRGGTEEADVQALTQNIVNMIWEETR